MTKPEAAQQLMGQGGIPNIGLASGRQIKFIKLEHVWVEAFVDYVPSRGAVNKKPNTWVPMDASYKQYTYTQGMDIKGQVPLDAQALITQAQTGATVESAGWVQNINGVARRPKWLEASGIKNRMAATLGTRRGTTPRADGDNAGTLEIGQQDSLHSKYRCFVEYRYGQIKMANRHRVPRSINTWL